MLISETLDNRKHRFLGYIMRSDVKDPLHQVTFTNTGNRTLRCKRRVGRPRQHWTKSTMQQVYQTHTRNSFDDEDDDQILEMFALATARLF